MVLVHLFGYFSRVDLCPSSLPLGVGDWLRHVIVAFPGLFYLKNRSALVPELLSNNLLFGGQL